MKKRWGAAVAVGAMTQLLTGPPARADMPIAQATPTQPAPPPPYMQPPPPPYTQPPSPPYMQPPPVMGPRVILRIDRPTARLQQQTMLGWRNICIPPCGAVVDPSVLYRVGGGGATVSEPFQLPRASGDVFVDGHVGSKASRLVGLGFMIAGALTAAWGAWVLVEDPAREGDRSRNVGLGGLGVALSLEVIGVALFSLSRTSLDVR